MTAASTATAMISGARGLPRICESVDRRCAKPLPPPSSAAPTPPDSAPAPAAAGCAPVRPMRVSGLIKELACESMRLGSPECWEVLLACALTPTDGHFHEGDYPQAPATSLVE